MARADIVILDWRLNPTSGANALPLLKRILTDDQPRRLRLIAFYTGEPNHERIREKIVECLNGLDGPDQAAVASDGSGNAIGFRACRIVVYGKPGSGTVEPGTVVDEEALADRLIADFADVVEGLLPSLVLTALGAVRENVHRLLECFGHDLDPAFLVHRACLPQPPESEQHIVEQIASELHGIMDDAVDQWSPAGIGAIERWLKGRFPDSGIELAPRKRGNQGKSMSCDDTLAMLQHGIATESLPLKKDGKEYDLLSHGFSGGADNSRELDRRLAAAMSLRQVPPATWRQLSMGTVVIQTGSDEPATLLCITPRCDSVRLTEKTRFLFVPLTDAKPNTPQIVVPVDDDQHRRMTIPLNPSQWRSVDFVPDSDRQCVLAHRNGTGAAFHLQGCPRQRIPLGRRAEGGISPVDSPGDCAEKCPGSRSTSRSGSGGHKASVCGRTNRLPHLAGTPRSAQPPPPDPSSRIPRSPSPASRVRAGLLHCAGPEPHCPRTCPPRTGRGSSGWRHTCSRDAGARSTREP